MQKKRMTGVIKLIRGIKGMCEVNASRYRDAEARMNNCVSIEKLGLRERYQLRYPTVSVPLYYL